MTTRKSVSPKDAVPKPTGQPVKTPIKIVIGATTYNFVCDGKVNMLRINDRAQAVRTTGASDGFVGQWRDPLLINKITDAFGGRVIGSHSRRSIANALFGSPLGNYAEGSAQIHVLSDSECETRFGVLTLPRQKNTLTMPTHASAGVGTRVGEAIFGGAASTGTIGKVWSRQMYNDQPAVYFSGSSVQGVFVWEGYSYDGAITQFMDSYAWTGSGFGTAVALTGIDASVAANNEINVFDQVVHKGALYAVGTNVRTVAANNVLTKSTTGNTWSVAGLVAGAAVCAVAILEGTRLLDYGNSLYFFLQGASKRIDVGISTDAGATSTLYANVALGQLRSKFVYYDTSGTERVMFMTEDAVYASTATAGVFARLYILPYPGRAAIVWGGSLFIYMDAMHCIKYTQGSSTSGPPKIVNLDPGGGEAMPSGKDFRETATGSVVVAAGSLGPFAAYMGDGSTSGTLNRALCMQYIEQPDGTDGMHFLWRAANTTNRIAYGARALFLDPVSGDLCFLGANYATSNETRTHDTVRIIKAETDPRTLAASIFETAGYAEMPIVSIPPSSIVTGFWQVYYNCENLTTGVTLQTQYGVDGAAATNVTLETNGAPDAAKTAVNRAQRLFPTDATIAATAASSQGLVAVGLAATTFHARWNFAGTATVSPLVYDFELAYTKMPDAKYIYVCDIIVEAQPALGVLAAATQWTNLKTIDNTKTKFLLTYSKEEAAVMVAALPQGEAIQMMHSGAAPSAPRDGTWRFFFGQI